jgi:hypothetical protein
MQRYDTTFSEHMLRRVKRSPRFAILAWRRHTDKIAELEVLLPLASGAVTKLQLQQQLRQHKRARRLALDLLGGLGCVRPREEY